MSNVVWFAGLVIILIMLWAIVLPCNDKVEGFGERVHAKIGSDGEVIYFSKQSPSQNGELGCTQVPCPKGMKDNVTCWCCCNFH